MICTDLKGRYRISITQRGFDGDPVHFYVRFLPKWSDAQLILLLKSNASSLLFKKHLKVKIFSELETSGQIANTWEPYHLMVRKNIILNPIKHQGKTQSIESINYHTTARFMTPDLLAQGNQKAIVTN